MLQWLPMYPDNIGPSKFAILLKGKFIGIIGFPVIDNENFKCGFFYQLIRTQWGNGYAYEAAEAILSYIHQQHINANIIADAVTANPASIKILKKLGFKQTGLEKSGFRKNGMVLDVYHFEMEKERFLVRKLCIDELYSLTELFQYNDIDEMISENYENIENEIIDIFVLYDEGKLLGELHIMYESEDEIFAIKGKRAYLYAYRIRKEYQNQGIGKILLKRVLEKLESEGYSEFTVGVEDDNDRAKHIYHEMGFRDVIARKRDSFQGNCYEYDLLLRKVTE